MKRRALLAVTLPWMMAVGLVACGSDKQARTPSADESRVCGDVQHIVDELGAQRPTAALATLPELEIASRNSTNPKLATAGKQFFDDLFTNIDYTKLTIQQTADLGREYQRKLATSMDTIVAECARAGVKIERLP